jgi:hypothetical protein
MVDDLDRACHESLDPPDGPPPVVVQRIRTGRRGRPRIEIDPHFLSHALSLRGPTGIAPTVGVSSRSIRRRALQYGLVEPGAPVFQIVLGPDGTHQTVHTSTSAPISDMSDEALDAAISSILQIFPTFGRRMITGHLRNQGQRVPINRITHSYLRVHGTPGIFGDRQIVRKEYRVPGPLSLAHMDGQHGEHIY